MVQFGSVTPRNDAGSRSEQYGHHVSHAKNRVNRRFMPNLQMGRVTVAGKPVHARICTRCLRTYSA